MRGLNRLFIKMIACGGILLPILELRQKTFCASYVFANLWFYLMLMFNFKINCYMLETLAVAPLFYSIWKTSVLVWHPAVLLSLFLVWWLQHTTKKTTVCSSHGTVKNMWLVGLLAMALSNGLAEFIFPDALFMFSFLCHKPQSDTWVSVERGRGTWTWYWHHVGCCQDIL